MVECTINIFVLKLIYLFNNLAAKSVFWIENVYVIDMWLQLIHYS